MKQQISIFSSSNYIRMQRKIKPVALPELLNFPHSTTRFIYVKTIKVVTINAS